MGGTLPEHDEHVSNMVHLERFDIFEFFICGGHEEKTINTISTAEQKHRGGTPHPAQTSS
jgi:hypothetical protein